MSNEPELVHFPVCFMVRVTREEGETDSDLQLRIVLAIEDAMDSHAGNVSVFAASRIVVNDPVKED